MPINRAYKLIFVPISLKLNLKSA